MKVILHIGLDVHNDSIAVSLAPSDSTEVRRYGLIGGSQDHVQKLVKQLQAAHPDATLKFCYERRGRAVIRSCASCARWATSASSCVPRACRAGRATG